ncbi:MAG: putative lipid II flippase FtsW [Acidobacteria bacterium]|nr:putative lipid II flippase FtsW [Acidobacteriota bacterium]MBU4254713.1 putative lipid II flippase FtsW [Acidobacteriota bacterium]
MKREHEFFKPFAFDRPLFFITLILVTLGIVMVFSASGVLSSERFGHPFHYLIHQLFGAGVGFSLILILMRLEIPLYENLFVIYSFLVLTMVLLVLCLFMPAERQVQRWIILPNFRFQPSELAKLSLILFLAGFIALKKEKINHPINLAIPLMTCFTAIFLILKEPDYSTAALICITCFSMLFIGGVKFKYFLFPGLLTMGVFSLALLLSNYKMERFLSFLNPTQDPLDSGFHAIQSKLAVSSGGIFSLNIGESIQKLFFLPAAHTDYIYAIIGEELGLVGTLAVIILFAAFLWRGLVIAQRAPSLFSRIAAAGITLAIFFQAVLNISIVLGLGPSTGIPLPFISYGRSSLVMTLCAVGILLHISQRRTNRW